MSSPSPKKHYPGPIKTKLKNISVQTSARLNYSVKGTSTKPDTCDKETYVKHFAFSEISTQTNCPKFSPLPNKFNKSWMETPKESKPHKSNLSFVEDDDVSLKSELERFEHNVMQLRTAEEKLKGSLNVGNYSRVKNLTNRTPKIIKGRKVETNGKKRGSERSEYI